MKIDRALVRRVEGSSAAVTSLQAHAIAALSPDSGATARPLDGGALIAMGPGRYVNRATGLGLGEVPAGELVDALDEFYATRDMSPSLELSPWASEPFIQLLAARGYRAERFRNVYVAALPVATPSTSEHSIEPMTDATAAGRREVLAGGSPPDSAARRTSDEMCDATALVPDAHQFVALVDGEVAACGALNAADGVGWLGGAATLPAHQGKGLQTALLHHRLRLAHDLGLELAAATALPDGQSARNLVACGFQLLYTQAVLTRM